MTTVSGDDELRAEINVTPLVDVVLVLLVILLLVAPMLKEELPVELPLAAHADEPAEDVPPTLTIAADGSIAFEGTPLPSDDLPTRLAAIYAGRATRRCCSPPTAGLRMPASLRSSMPAARPASSVSAS